MAKPRGKIYKTSEVAKLIGIHVNTVRLYEKYGLIPAPARQANGYRIYTDRHIEQFRLARAALWTEVLQNGLRKQAIEIIKTSASGEYDRAAELTEKYIAALEAEKENAEEAVRIVRCILTGADDGGGNANVCLTRKEAAKQLHVTIDTLRNWELNGLFTIKRQKNGYRVYNAEDMRRLKVIRSLRCADYSLSAILRMLNAISADPDADLRHAIDTPMEEDDIISVCDKLLTSLKEAEENAQYVAEQITKLKNAAD